MNIDNRQIVNEFMLAREDRVLAVLAKECDRVKPLHPQKGHVKS